MPPPVTTAPDAARAWNLLAALGVVADQQVHFVTIPGVPYPKSRPRFGARGHAFSKPEDVTAEHRTGVFLRASVRRPFTGNVALACVFYRDTLRRVDSDNLLKHVCDAGNRIMWHDDSQCTGLTGVVDLDRDNPRTVVAITVHQSGLVRDMTNPKKPRGALL